MALPMQKAPFSRALCAFKRPVICIQTQQNQMDTSEIARAPHPFRPKTRISHAKLARNLPP